MPIGNVCWHNLEGTFAGIDMAPILNARGMRD